MITDFPRSFLETFCLAPCSILQAPRNFLTYGAQLVTPSHTTLIVSPLFHLHFILELLPKDSLVWTWVVACFSVCPVTSPAVASGRYSGKSPRKDLAWESFQFLPQWMSTQMVKFLQQWALFSVLFYAQIIIRLYTFYGRFLEFANRFIIYLIFSLLFVGVFFCLFLKFLLSLPYCALTASLRLSSFLVSSDISSAFWKIPSLFK